MEENKFFETDVVDWGREFLKDIKTINTLAMDVYEDIDELALVYNIFDKKYCHLIEKQNQDYKTSFMISFGIFFIKMIRKYRKDRKIYKIFKDQYKNFTEATWKKCQNTQINYFHEKLIENCIDSTALSFYHNYVCKISIFKTYVKTVISYKNTFCIFKENQNFRTLKTSEDLLLDFPVDINTNVFSDFINVIENIAKVAMTKVFTQKLVDEISNNSIDDPYTKKILSDITLFYVRNTEFTNSYMRKEMKRFMESMEKPKRFFYEDTFMINDEGKQFVFKSVDENEFRIAESMAPFELLSGKIESIEPPITEAYNDLVQYMDLIDCERVEYPNVMKEPFDVQKIKTEYQMLFVKYKKLYDKLRDLTFLDSINRIVDANNEVFGYSTLRSIELLVKDFIKLYIGDYYIKTNGRFVRLGNNIIYNGKYNRFEHRNEFAEVNVSSSEPLRGLEVKECLGDYDSVKEYVEETFKLNMEKFKNDCPKYEKTMSEENVALKNEVLNLVVAGINNMLEDIYDIRMTYDSIIEKIAVWPETIKEKIEFLQTINYPTIVNYYVNSEFSLLHNFWSF